MPSFKEILEEAENQVPWEYLRCHKTCETIINHYKTLFPQPFKLDVLKKIYRELVVEEAKLTEAFNKLLKYLELQSKVHSSEYKREHVELRTRISRELRTLRTHIKGLKEQIMKKEVEEFFLEFFETTNVAEIQKFFEQPVTNDKIAEKIIRGIRAWKNRNIHCEYINEYLSRFHPHPVPRIDRAIETAIKNIQTYQIIENNM